MANPEITQFEEDNLLAGDLKSAYKNALTGTYYRGQAMGKLEDGTYVDLDTVGTYDVLNETDIPIGAAIVINATIAAASGTAVLVGDTLYVTDATDAALAEVGRVAVAGSENWSGVCAADVTLAADGTIPIYIILSELQAIDIVDGSGVSLTITDTLIENAQEHGLLIKE